MEKFWIYFFYVGSHMYGLNSMSDLVGKQPTAKRNGSLLQGDLLPRQSWIESDTIVSRIALNFSTFIWNKFFFFFISSQTGPENLSAFWFLHLPTPIELRKQSGRRKCLCNHFIYFYFIKRLTLSICILKSYSISFFTDQFLVCTDTICLHVRTGIPPLHNSLCMTVRPQLSSTLSQHLAILIFSYMYVQHWPILSYPNSQK